ncbi:phosphorylated adapter RNA export [Cryptosporidium sp. chipmunk genotype I]|uniref:phosphorylated adapter RNA export n=1 Tax=Cryptosporidium sp. chipmunk genotype I TaxID=1280935 RepID=UPI00351A4AB0|nr:phosphorylated adapter RNA export [Cryptosporidium sp. chipmunk genotype I]
MKKKADFLSRLKLLRRDDQERIKIFSKLVKELKEPNIYLLERIVYYIPKELVYRIFNETRIVIKNGGYPTEDSTRLKSPGGIFFRLIRNQISHEEYKRIWNIQRRKKKHKDSKSPLGRINDNENLIENKGDKHEEGELSEEAILMDDLKCMYL